MHRSSTIHLDAVIFGGGAAGVWLLDELIRRGNTALLLEAHALGAGQTIASQGIIHGGLKYTLDGLLRRSASAIRDMPQIWRDCLAGRRRPDLTHTRLRADHCYLWRTESFRSKVGMIGARVGLRVAPTTVEKDDRPAALTECAGTVARLDEQVIDPGSFLRDLLQQHQARILRIDAERGLQIDPTEPSGVIRLMSGRDWMHLAADDVILAAGTGNEQLRGLFKLPTKNAMQRRPLHMVMARGASLPPFNGHCVDGAHTRVTITSDTDSDGRVVWQVGGQLAEDGVEMDEAQLIAHAHDELEAVLPSMNFATVEWATYRIDRAEGSTASGARPDDVRFLIERTLGTGDGNVITAFPTKLALVPRLADRIVRAMQRQPLRTEHPELSTLLATWPRPSVAQPPWETATQWFPAR